MNRSMPAQAVILAGGRGERLKPFTDSSPKPMIPFDGRPFLEYLIEMLKGQGISKVLLLLGYLPGVIQRHFGTGKKWGVEIEYHVSAPEFETGRRLYIARHMIDPNYLLMYCDNYWPMDLKEMWKQYQSKAAEGMITVYGNEDKYTKDNVTLDEEGYVTCYDKTRTQSGLSGVDIGYMFFKNSILETIGDENVSFEKKIFPQLVSEKKLLAYKTNHRYYSIGSHERLSLTERFLKRSPTILLDRDGVMNKKMPRAEYVCSWKDWQWLPGVKNALKLLKDAGYRVILISNQAGIARGAMTENDLENIHTQMIQEVIEAGGEIHAIYYCPHGWDDGCACRKPLPGMLFQAQRDYDLDLSQIYFVGDDVRDEETAQHAGAKFLRVDDKKSLLQLIEEEVMVAT